jgi:glycine/serine hydroxymethyltransferase
MSKSYIQKQDKKVFDAIKGEEKRQKGRPRAHTIRKLCFKSMYSKQTVLVFTNKYSEGYPGTDVTTVGKNTQT